MSAYQPPRANLIIFDSSVFTETNGDSLTQTQANNLYLKFPLGQGAETIPALTVSGDLQTRLTEMENKYKMLEKLLLSLK